MIDSILANHENIRTVLSKEEYIVKVGMLLSSAELEILRDARDIYEIFKNTTENLSGKILLLRVENIYYLLVLLLFQYIYSFGYWVAKMIGIFLLKFFTLV